MNIRINKSIFTAIALLLSTSATAGIIDVSNTFGSVTEQNNVFTLTTSGNTDTELENLLELGAGSLDALSTGNATDGSAINGEVNVLSGQTFSFDFLFDSSEGLGSTFNDFSFLSLTLNNVDILNGLELLADSSTPDNILTTFSTTFSSNGLLNFGIGVLNVNDTAVDSNLTVSSLQISEVPEPSTIAIFALGLMGLVSRRFVKK